MRLLILPKNVSDFYSLGTYFVENTAVALAMSRDNSSGGCIRLAVITESGVERIFVPGNQLP